MAEASPAGERITGIGQLVRPGLLDSKWFKSGGKGLKLYMVDERLQASGILTDIWMMPAGQIVPK
jgi:hypothetical protein